MRSSRGGAQPVIALIAIVSICVAAFFIIRQTRPKEDVASGGVYYFCTACQKEFVDSDKDPPVKCPNCDQLTGVYLRKSRCKQCGQVFRAYILKWDPEIKRLRERRRRGENVPFREDEDELVSEPDGDHWVNSSSPEGIDLLTNISCPHCKASGQNVEPVFPKGRSKK